MIKLEDKTYDLRTLEGKNAYLYCPEDRCITFIGKHQFIYGNLSKDYNSEVL